MAAEPFVVDGLASLAETAPLFSLSGKRLDQKVLVRIRAIERRSGIAVLVSVGSGVGARHKVDLESLRSAAPELFERGSNSKIVAVQDQAISDLERREAEILGGISDEVRSVLDSELEGRFEAYDARLHELQARDDAVARVVAGLRNELGLAKAMVVSLRIKVQVLEERLGRC